MNSRTMRLATIAAVAAVLASCNDKGAPFEPGPEPEFTTAAAVAEGTLDARSSDRGTDDHSLFDALGNEIPGFAGFWFDRACNLNVVLTTGEGIEEARRILAPYLRRYLHANPRCPDTATIIVHRGVFTWKELSRFAAALAPATEIPGVARLGISIPMNRIIIAVTGRPPAVEVLRLAARVGVPGDAIKFTLVDSPSGRTDRTGG